MHGPQWEGLTTYNSGAETQNITIISTTAGLTEGNLYVVFLSYWSTNNTDTPTIDAAWISGGGFWAGTGNPYVRCWPIYRYATGDADDELVVDIKEAKYSAALIYEFSNAKDTPQRAISAGSPGSNPNLTGMTPVAGNDSYIFLACYARRSTYTGTETSPSGYSTLYSFETTAPLLHGCYKPVTGTTEDPGACSGMASCDWVGILFAIQQIGPIIESETITHPHRVSVPTLTTADYGIKTWASDGTLTMDTNYTQLLVVYTVTVGAAESDDVDIPAIDGKSVLIWTTLQDYLWATRVAPHTVTRSGTNIAWVPAASAPGITTIVVFIYD